MAKAEKTETVQDRVKRLRLAIGCKTQQEMADYIGVSFNRWNNVERGLPLGLDLATVLCRKVRGVTLGWLYFGETHGISLEMAEALGEKIAQPPSGLGPSPSRPGTSRNKRPG